MRTYGAPALALLNKIAQKLISGVPLSGMVDTELEAAVLAADAMSNPTVPQVLSHWMAWNGATWDRVKAGKLYDVDSDAAGRLLVSPPSVLAGLTTAELAEVRAI